MFYAMVIEDSKPIARDIKRQVEAAHPRVRVTAVVYNGLEALQLLKEHPVDLVITDIRMPRMDGLTFIAEAKRLRPQLKFVILSGYSDFDYARQAIQLGVSDYLLKPLVQSELSTILERLVSEIETKRRIELADQIAYNLSQEDPNKAFEMPGHWQGFCLAVIRFGYFKTGNIAINREELEHHVRNHFSDLECIVADSPGEAEKIAVLALSEGQSQSIDENMMTFHAFLKSVHPLPFLAYSPEATSSHQIAPLYRMLSRHLDHQVKPGMPQCWYVERELYGNRMQNSDSFEERAKTKCIALIKNGRQSALEEELDALAKHWESTRASIFQIKTGLNAMFHAALPMYHPDMVDELLSTCESYADISRKAMDKLSPLMEQSEPRGQIIQQIDDFFRANLHRHINMQELSENLNYSATYIIRVVKQSRGMTPIEYFNKMKIDEAKKMLDSNENIMVKDIADALGFTNQHYFSKVFKQYTGCTPSEYKNRRTH